MRLIDADIFKEYVMKGFRDNESLLETEEYRDFARRIAESFCLDIDEQPTAYDVNNVVDSLVAIKTVYLLITANSEDENRDLVYRKVANALDKAIEMVKAGGL